MTGLRNAGLPAETPEQRVQSTPHDEGSFRAIIENSSDIIARFDLQLRCIYLNRSIQRYQAHARQHLLGKTLLDSGLPTALARDMLQGMEQVRIEQREQRIELTVRRQRERHVFEMRLFPEFDEAAMLTSVLCIAREITEASQAKRLLTEENAVLEMIADSLPVNQIMQSICKMIESQLPGCMSAIMTRDQAGHSLSLAAAPSLPPAYAEQLEHLPIGPEVAACGTAAFWQRSIIVGDMTQSPLWDSLGPQALESGLRACWSTPIFTSDHQLLGTLALYYDEPRTPSPAELRLIYRCSHIAAIALQRNLHESQLYLLATQDGLTHLFNRRHFMDAAERHLSQAKRYQRPVAVMMMDLDHFKAINDQHGHAIGDRVLAQFSQICLNCLRASDIVGRMGGEEFAALLPDSTLAEARQVAERLRQQVEMTELRYEGNSIRFQVSIGITHRHDNDSLDIMLMRADKQLYQAKAQGRNRVCLPEEEILPLP